MHTRIAISMIAVAVTAVSLAVASFAQAAPSRDGDAIWIVTDSGDTARSGAQLSYGSAFKAGYSSRARQPWAYAQCFDDGTSVLGTPNQGTYTPGAPIWSAYISLTGLTGDTFQLIDPIQGLWLGGGARCDLNLVTFAGNKKSTLATMNFTVVG